MERQAANRDPAIIAQTKQAHRSFFAAVRIRSDSYNKLLHIK
jgi:hypothetical protein